MQPKVHILATCRNADIIRGTTLVFDTIRTGFPNAEIRVYENALPRFAQKPVRKACDKAGCMVVESKPTIHHEWIESLLATENEPFYICDTDVVFWKSFEGFTWPTALAGRFVPQFYDEFTNCITRARLHGSLLYIDPAMVKAGVSTWLSQFPKTDFNPPANLIHPLVIPSGSESYFHDTCCLLYQAIGGSEFNEAHLDCYDHLNCGTISDLVAPHVTDLRMREAHFAVFENPLLAKGVWTSQDEYYRRHAA